MAKSPPKPKATRELQKVAKRLKAVENQLPRKAGYPFLGDSVGTHQLKADAVTTDELAAGSVTADQLSASSVTADALSAGSVTADALAVGSVTADALAVGSVTADAITAGAITTDALAAGAVTATKIASETITAGQIAAGTITGDRITAGTLTSTHIQAGSINSDRLYSGSIQAQRIQTQNLAANVVTANELAAHTITAGQIAAGTVTATEVSAASLTADRLASHTITAAQIAAGTITATEIASATITAAQIAAGTITATQIAANTITAAKIAANTITAAQIAAGTITATEIATATIVAGNIAASTITATQIATGTITGSLIAGSTITATNLATGSVTAAKISVSQLSAITADMGTLTAGKIRVGTAGGARIEVGAGIALASGTFDGIAGADSANNVTFKIDAATGNVTLKGTIASGSTGLDNFTDTMNGGTRITAATVTGDRLVVDTITAREIASATITSVEIASATITAGNIAAGTITATQIASGTITADRLNVTTLSAITADAGTITAGTIRTASAVPYVQMESSNNRLAIYDSGGVAQATLDGTTGLRFQQGNLAVNGVEFMRSGTAVSAIYSISSGNPGNIGITANRLGVTFAAPSGASFALTDDTTDANVTASLQTYNAAHTQLNSQLVLFGDGNLQVQGSVLSIFGSWAAGASGTGSIEARVNGAGFGAAQDVLQNGVVLESTGKVSAVSVNAATGAITFTTIGGYAWVKSATTILVRVALPGGTFTLTPPTLPASGNSRAVGIEVAVSSDLSLTSGAASAGNVGLDTLASPAQTSGKLRFWTLAIANVGGSYQLAATPNSRDRRPWARGALYTYERFLGDYTGTTPWATIDATNMKVRLECMGVPVRVRLMGFAKNSTADLVYFGLWVDGVQKTEEIKQVPTGPGYTSGVLHDYIFTPSPGSHLFEMKAQAATGTWTVGGGTTANRNSAFIVEELVRQNAGNGTS